MPLGALYLHNSFFNCHLNPIWYWYRSFANPRHFFSLPHFQQHLATHLFRSGKPDSVIDMPLEVLMSATPNPSLTRGYPKLQDIPFALVLRFVQFH